MAWQAIATTYSKVENHVSIIALTLILIALAARIIDMILDNGNITASLIEIVALILAIPFIIIPIPNLETKCQQSNQPNNYIPISTEYIDITDSYSKTVTEYVNTNDKTIWTKTVEYDNGAIISKSFSQKLNDSSTPATYTGDIDELQNFYDNN